jgi:hypothetical protein
MIARGYQIEHLLRKRKLSDNRVVMANVGETPNLPGQQANANGRDQILGLNSMILSEEHQKYMLN